MRITSVDVGQGDAIWIQEADGWNGRRGANLIIDGGPDTGPRNRLIKFLQDSSYGLKGSDVIDCMVATHPHPDHYAGPTDVLDQYQVVQIVDAGFPKDHTTASGRVSRFESFR